MPQQTLCVRMCVSGSAQMREEGELKWASEGEKLYIDINLVCFIAGRACA